MTQYANYRAKQRRESTSKSIWSDELEKAFMEAIQKIPKIGRGKLPMGTTKQWGRNELIAEYIYKVTGKRRTRKQVSSHIQVLKGLLRNCPEFMKHVTTEPKELSDNWDIESQWDGVMESNDSLSAYGEPTPRTRPVYHRTDTSGTHDTYYNTSIVSPPPSACKSNFQFSVPRIELSLFDMWVGAANETEGVDRCFHTYTKLAPEESKQQAAIPLDVLPEWRTRFPHVAELMDGREIGTDFTILHASTSISLMANAPPLKSTLCTQVQVTLPIGSGLEGRTWECVTRIYEPAKKVSEFSHTVPLTNELNGTTTLRLPFISDFWSELYKELSQARHQHNDGEDSGMTRRREGEVRATIRGITVVQDLFSTSHEGLGVKERLALLLWEFSKADRNHEGKAVWREITPFRGPTSVLAHNRGLPVTTAASTLCDSQLLTAVTDVRHKYNTVDWHNQYPQNIPISPFGGLSPSAMVPYYTFDSNSGCSGFSRADDSANTLLATDMNMGYFPQQPQHTGEHQQQVESYTSYVLTKLEGLTSAAHAEVEQLFGVGTAGDGSWPQPQHQHNHHHWSPVSETQNGVVELGF